MIKQRLEPDKALHISDIETQIRLIIISRIENRDEYKQKQLTHYTNKSKNN